MPHRTKRAFRIRSFVLHAVLALGAANFSYAEASAPDAAAVKEAPVAEQIATTLPAPPVAPATPVTLVKAKTALWPDQIEASGSIMPWQETLIGSEVGGLRLADVLISVGDTVTKGQVLARLDTATVETDLDAANAQLMEAEGTLAQAVATLDRANRLAPSGGLSRQELTLYETQKNTAEARVNAARAQVKRQKLRLKFATIVAPDDGVISAISVSEGAIVQAGNELFRLIRQGRLEWRAEVKGETLLKLAIGQEVIVNSPLGSEVKGRVRRLSPTIDVTTGNGLVYVDLPTGTNLKAGLNVSGSIGMSKRKALYVPSSAVVRGDKDAKVFKIGADSKLVAVDVRTGRSKGDAIEIVSGLDERSEVIAADVDRLEVGQLVDSSVHEHESESPGGGAEGN
ncbi:MAG: efflux RND transporter periplasmic adaptor subunit [Propionivibrio sp.]|uniref:efflux RND transporter periplasmic adaptor subunit n=1 Tax=Propionivibrio sp. TaxID=2212460 RepID=UPI001B56F3F5|nr:efflux RND transporter periplasmic adaptor subunit [Propionivibrio sp.]MBP7203368.1 efflux RND transporter periplasmic adaptor subunit [Propionivibrio sp.]